MTQLRDAVLAARGWSQSLFDAIANAVSGSRWTYLLPVAVCAGDATFPALPSGTDGRRRRRRVPSRRGGARGATAIRE